MAKRTPGKPTGVEEVLAEFNVTGELNHLIERGCDKNQLLSLLVLASKPPFDPSGWGHIVGMSSKDRKRFLSKVARFADELEALNTPELRYWLKHFWKTPWVLELPKLLRQYVSTVNAVQRWAAPRQDNNRAMYRCLLIHHVKESTGRFCDRELSSLLAAVLGNADSVEAHAEWRKKHYKRFVAKIPTEDPSTFLTKG